MGLIISVYLNPFFLKPKYFDRQRLLNWFLLTALPYFFETINPNLGVAQYDDKEITLADIPGLIEGAHEGIGLGIKFLKHIERCKSLIHLIDINEKNVSNAYKQVRNELKKYSKDLTIKKEIVILNKIDLVDKKTLNDKKKN